MIYSCLQEKAQFRLHINSKVLLSQPPVDCEEYKSFGGKSQVVAGNVQAAWAPEGVIIDMVGSHMVTSDTHPSGPCQSV